MTKATHTICVVAGGVVIPTSGRSGPSGEVSTWARLQRVAPPGLNGLAAKLLVAHAPQWICLRRKLTTKHVWGWTIYPAHKVKRPRGLALGPGSPGTVASTAPR